MSSVKELEINNTVYDIKGKTVVDNNSGELSFWSGSKAQYDAIVTKDANTLYNITDDTDVSLTILEALYPVGSIYITTNAACPLSTLIAGSTWVQETSRVLVEKKEPTDNDLTWYNLYSDGWCEQGGHIPQGSGTSGTITFLKPFSNTNYTVVSNTGNDAANNYFIVNTYTGKATSSVSWYKSANGLAGDWQACGYTSTTTSHKQFRRTA